jgi:hypothetical protein
MSTTLLNSRPFRPLKGGLRLGKDADSHLQRDNHLKPNLLSSPNP